MLEVALEIARWSAAWWRHLLRFAAGAGIPQRAAHASEQTNHWRNYSPRPWAALLGIFVAAVLAGQARTQTFDLGGTNQTLGTLPSNDNAVTNSGNTDAILTLTGPANETINGGITNGGSASTGLTYNNLGGVLILSGNNNYSGPTEIIAGTLQVSSATALGNGSAVTVGTPATPEPPVVAAATLDLNGNSISIGSLSGTTAFGMITNNGSQAATLTVGGDNTSTTFAGRIFNGTSQTTALTKVGTGTLILTGSNAYSGATTISAGTLQFGNGGTVGSTPYIKGAITNNANLTFNFSNEQIFGGAITGTGTLNQNGTSTLVLFGASNYSGGTTINSGTLQIGNFGTVGSITGNVVNNGNLEFARSDNVTFNGTISGSGSVGALGGQLTLTATNTYTGFTAAGDLALAGSGSISDSKGVLVSGGSTFDISGVTSQLNVPSQYSSTIGGLGLVGTTINTLQSEFSPIPGGGTINLGGNTLYINQDNSNLISNANANFSGSITGTASPLNCAHCPSQGVSLVKDGASTLTLSGSGNTYTGFTAILNGTLALSGTGNINSSAGVVIANGGAFDISQTTKGATVQSIQTLDDQSTLSTAKIYLGGQTLTVTTGSNGNNTDNFAGVISDGGGGTGGSLVMAGTGTLTLSNKNTYTGATVINGGTLALQTLCGNCDGGNQTNPTVVSTGDIGASSGVKINTGATFDVSQLFQGNFQSTTTTVAAISDGSGGGGNIYLGNNTLDINQKTNTAFSGVISDCGAGGNSCGAGANCNGSCGSSFSGSLIKDGTGILSLTGNNTYSGGTTVSGGFINFNSANNFGSKPITLNGGGLQWAAGNTTDISGQLTPIGTNGGSFDTNGNNVTFNTALIGSGSISKDGAGTLTLAVANSYAGGTTINGGYINFSTASNFGSGQITLNGGGLQWASGNTTDISSRLTAIGSNGGSFDLNGNNVTLSTALTGAGGVTVVDSTNANSKLTLSAANTYTGATTIGDGTNAVTLALSGNGSVSQSSQVAIATKGTFDISRTNGASIATLADSAAGQTGNVALGSQTLTISNGSTTFSGVIADGGIGGGSGGSLTIAGGTQSLAGANTYTGMTTISAGALALSGSGNISQSSGVTIAGGANFDISGVTTVLPKFQLTGTTISSLQDGLNASPNGSTIHLGGYALQINQQGTTTFSGDILSGGSNGGSGGTLILSGGGTLILKGNESTYFGNTIVAGSTLAGGTKDAFSANSGVYLIKGATLDLGGYDQQIASLSDGNNTLVFGKNLGAGTVTNNGSMDAVLTIAGSMATTFSGAITDGKNATTGLTLSNGASLTLSGTNNTYSGVTTVGGGPNASVLAAGAAGAFSANSAVQIASGSILDLGSQSQTIAGLSGSGTVTSLTNPQTASLGSTAVLTISGAGGVSTFGGAIQDGQSNTPAAGVLTGLTVTNGYSLTLTGNNTYSGGTNITGGSTVAIGQTNGVASSLGTGGVSLIDGTLQNVSGKALTFGDTQQFNIGSTGGGGATINLGGSSGGDIMINGKIADVAGAKSTPLIVIGGNTLTLTNSSNGYSGGTGVVGSTLAVANSGAAGSGWVTLIDSTFKSATPNNTLDFVQTFYVGSIGGSGAVTGATIDLNGVSTTMKIQGLVADASTLVSSVNGQTVTAAPLTVTGGGTLVLTNANTYTGGTVVTGGSSLSASQGSAGVSSVGTGAVTLDNGTFVNLSAFSGVTFANDFKLGTGGGTINTIGGNITLTGSVTDGSSKPGSLTVNGGSTLTLGPSAPFANTYSGTTTIGAGTTLAAGTANALSANSAVLNMGKLDLGSQNQTIGGLSGSGTVTNLTNLQAAQPGDVAVLTVNNGGTFDGTIIDGSVNGVTTGLNVAGGTLTLTNANSYSGGTTVSSGTLRIGTNTVGTPGAITSSAIGTGTLTFDGGTLQAGGNFSVANVAAITANGGTIDANGKTFTYSGAIGDSAANVHGNLIITDTSASSSGSVVFTGTNTYSGTTTISAGTLALSGSGSIASSSLVIVGDGSASATFDISATTSGTSVTGLAGASDGTVKLVGQTLNVTSASSVNVFYGVITGTGGLTVTGTAQQELGGVNTYSGATTIDKTAYLSLVGSGSIAGSSKVIDNGGFDISVTSSGASITSLSGSGTVLLGGKTLTLSNANDIFSGTLGAVGDKGGLILSAGTQTLSGNSNYTGATTVNAGMLSVLGDISSSSSVTVNSTGILSGTGILPSVTFTGAGFLSPGTTANPTGSLSIKGNLVLSTASTYLVTINGSNYSSAAVTGTANLNGATLKIAATQITAGKTYTLLTANKVTGTFTSAPSITTPTGAFNETVTYTGNAVNAIFTNAIPSGSVTSGGQLSANDMQTSFASTLLNPNIAGRSGSPAGGYGSALGFAPEASTSPEAQAAYNAVTPHDPLDAVMRSLNTGYSHSVWASGYGGYSHNTGDSASGGATANTGGGGVASGIDFRLGADTVLGFALGGGATSWSISGGLGNGTSDIFQAGFYGSHRFGDAYISGTLAYAFDSMKTTRNVTAPTASLNASFNANGITGRIEGGYRFGSIEAGLTPYVAGNFSALHTPSYSETTTTPGASGFAVSYASQTQTNERGEIGIWADKLFPVQGDAVVRLGAKAGYAHDWWSSTNFNAQFVSLPTQSFTMTGITPPANLGLASALAEIRYRNGVSLSAKFDAEFGSNAYSLAGTGTFKYAW